MTKPAARTSRLRRRAAVALVAVGTVAGAVSCTAAVQPEPQAGAARTTTPSPSPSPTPTPTPTPTPPPPPVVWPLTGVVTPAVANRPALAVKIENSVDARPQTGLTGADLVYEEVVEGGITRFCAVYQSQLPASVGPVRSVRPMDPAIAAPLHGILAFSGGQPQYVSSARAAGLQVLTQDAGNRGFRRSSARPAPHNVYADPSALLAQADAGHQAAPAAPFAFAPAADQSSAATGQPISALHLTLSGSSHPLWTWDAGSGTWLRSEGARPAVQADGARLAATNVVVLRVQVVTTKAVDPAGNHVPETVLSGTGQALVASGGKTVAATWTKGAVGDPLALTGTDGQPVRLAPGGTWIELVPTGTGSVAVS